jgi:beta-barrel assembly-enhancing protease
MSARSDATPVWHYDGRSGVRRLPLLVLEGDGFVLEEGEVRSGPYRFADLTNQSHGASQRQYGLKKHPGWRIGLIEEPPVAVAALLPGKGRYGGVIDRIGLWPAAAAFALLSAAVVALVITTPALLARVIPRSVERQIGDLMVGDFGGRACSAPAGTAALQALSTRLGMASDVDLRVVDVPMVNAVTLPGGHVVVFSGLIGGASSADEVAGVIGHELGHVENRDVLESLLRQFGLSLVLGGMDGNVGGYTNALLSASYSRGAETRADGYAIDMLKRAQVSPMGSAELFQKLGKGEVKAKGAGAVLGYFASHPMSSERQKRFADSVGKGPYTPALDAAQWQALRNICSGGGQKRWGEQLGF